MLFIFSKSYFFLNGKTFSVALNMRSIVYLYLCSLFTTLESYIGQFSNQYNSWKLQITIIGKLDIRLATGANVINKFLVFELYHLWIMLSDSLKLVM